MVLWMNVLIWGPARGVRWLQIMRPMEGGMMINPSSFFLFFGGGNRIGVVGGLAFFSLCYIRGTVLRGVWVFMRFWYVWFWLSDKPCPKAEAERRLLM